MLNQAQILTWIKGTNNTTLRASYNFKVEVTLSVFLKGKTFEMSAFKGRAAIYSLKKFKL
jgi:hypothetical protein